MSDTQVIPSTALAPAPGLAYSADMVQRMRNMIGKEIAKIQSDAATTIDDLKTQAANAINTVEEATKAKVEELTHALREIEGRQTLLPTFHSLLPEGRQGYPDQPGGRDPYANAPAWADRTDERWDHIRSIPEDGGDDGEQRS